MVYRSSFCVVGVLALILPALAGADDEWKTIRVTESNAALDLPPVAQKKVQAGDFGDRVQFFLKAPFDSVVVILTQGRQQDFDLQWKLDTADGVFQQQYGGGRTRKVTYKVKKPNWFVATGTERTREEDAVFYVKALAADGNNFTRVEYRLFEYDDFKKKMFDALVERSVKTIHLVEK